jgi:anti-sigma factor RsiW
LKCEEIQVLVHGYLDGEIDLVRSLEIEQHLQECAACAAVLDQHQSLRAALQSPALYHRAPALLRQRIESSFRTAGTLRPRAWPRTRRWLAVAASIVLLVFGSWGVVRVMTAPSARDLLTQEVIASHVRSLLTDPPVAVASSDRHTVKPWFSGKVDFSPIVVDLSREGFPLIGGRLDYLNNKKVAALVYKRNRHWINLFIWPASSNTAEPARVMSRQGYHIVYWQKAALAYWAISDLNEEELQEFARLVQQ